MLEATSSFKLYYLEDKQEVQTIESIQKVEFSEVLASRFSLGYRDQNHSHWFAIDISSDATEEQLYLYFTNLFAKEFTFYYQGSSAKWHKKEVGYSQENRSDSIWTSKPTLKLPIQYHTRVFVKIKSDVAIVGEFLLFEGLSTLIEYQSYYYLFFALFFGVLLMSIAINLFLSLTLKEPIYSYYLGYLLFFGSFVFMVNSLHSTFATPLIIQIFRMFSPIALIFFILFSKELLQLKKIAPRLNMLLNLILVSMGFFIVMINYSTSPWYGMLAKFSTLLYALLIISTALAIYHRVTKARIYLFALLIQLVSSWMMANMYGGLLENNDINQYSFMVITMINFMLFTIILANRINEETQKKLQAEERLCYQRANYTQQLEQEVRERTQRVNQLLKEKEILLQEVYHRVKNNFHMVTSLLWIEQQNQKGRGQKEGLIELINRIKSMSFIHEYLLGLDDYREIDASEYMGHIIDALLRSYPKEELYIEYNIENCKLLSDEAFYLGVILNELLTNAIKHHNKQERCTIELSCRAEDGSVRLIVQDNGDGFDIDTCEGGFGVQLIEEFTSKLNATTKEYSFENGTEYRLFFPKSSSPL